MKKLHLIRHGESLHNEATYGKPEEYDPFLWDAELSQRGREQVEALKEKVKQIHPQLVVVSPLTRALQTAVGAFGNSVPVVVHPLASERLDNACDIGLPRSELEKVWINNNLDFSLMDNTDKEIWWFNPKGADQFNYKEVFISSRWKESYDYVLERIKQLEIWIRQREESEIAIVGHSTFFMLWLRAKAKLANCEIHTMELTSQLSDNNPVRIDQ